MSGLLFYMHGGSGNHGCEAIVTGLLGRGRLKGAQEEALLLSMRADEDRRYLPQNLCRIAEE
ncbi:MAG: polysaccharide pyruvyl transferase family protein, partial [Lachnospiraceae bacterium]|nr:polysaccharide pyruvyl transferase family protein [Lachnospiraceae bacterium]